MTLKTLRTEIAAVFEGVFPGQVSAYLLGNPTPPSVEVFPDPERTIEYDLTGSRGSDEWYLIVRVVVGWTADRGAQEILDEMLASSGDRSVKELVQAVEIPGAFLHVQSAKAYREYVRPSWDQSAIGAEWTVRIVASG